MEKNRASVLSKNQCMKKRFLVAVTILAASVSFAQQKKQPPPPPPKVNLDKFVPPPPPPPPPKAPAKERMDLPRDYSAFLKRNPTVKNLSWSEDKVRVHLKSGKEEVYNLNNREEMQKLQDKYGDLPVAPPPPPPPPKAPEIRSES
jgi:hypothetical protein